MQKSRTETLEEILQSRPEDAFARYGLALELAESGGLEGAWKHLEYLLDHSPEYLATYYQGGMILSRLEPRVSMSRDGLRVTTGLRTSLDASLTDVSLEQNQRSACQAHQEPCDFGLRCTNPVVRISGAVRVILCESS